MRFSCDEGQARFINAVSGAVTSVALVCGGIWAVVQYQHSKELEQQNRQKDAANLTLQLANAKFDTQRPFYQKQLELCETASASASILATAQIRNKADLEQARGDFWKLYWGPLGMVEKSGVEQAMVRFGACLQNSCSEPIENLSLVLAHACRDLISESWDLKLPPMDPGTKLEKNKPRNPPEIPGGGN